MKSIYSMSLKDLENWAIEKGWKSYRARQIFEWLYRKRVDNFDAMTNLSRETREKLKEDFYFSSLDVLKVQRAKKDHTAKYLFKTDDNMLLESVLMDFDYGKSLCVSTQVGCNMGCTFCASGLTKKQRDLDTSEIVGQILAVDNELKAKGERLSHIVVMGTGEPFDNYDNVMKALEIVNHDLGLAIGAGHITISTCGIPDKIRKFARGKYQYNLAISLHAPNNRLRSQIMPVNKAYPLEEVMDALDEYASLNNRKLTFEYILLRDVNDSREHARQLGKLLRGRLCYVNIIPYNEVEEKDYETSDYEDALYFYHWLRDEGLMATLREEHGGDIDAACGQLRIKTMAEMEAAKNQD